MKDKVEFSSLQIGFSTYSPTDLHHFLFELPPVTTSPSSAPALPSTVTINPQTAPPLSNSIRPLLLICFTVAYDEESAVRRWIWWWQAMRKGRA
ncbi:hypothetical protein M5689_018337 [Euphorbia peplus]|nr:hypothetical protein M5689_018337 [Euphorbia peplus]